MGEYVIKEKNIKNIIAYILLGIVIFFYGYFMFHYMPIAGIIVSGITLVVLALYLMEDIFKMTKKLMLSILGICYISTPILYWIIKWIISLTEGKDACNIFFGFLFGMVILVLVALLIGMIVCAIKECFFDD